MLKITQIAEIIEGKLEGDDALELRGVASLEVAGPEEISLFTDPRFRERLRESQALALVVDHQIQDPLLEGKTLLRVASPRLALARLLTLFHPPRKHAPGVNPHAWVDNTASVDPQATVMAGVFLGAGVKIGARSVLFPGVVLMEDVELGQDCLLHPGAVLAEGTRLGNRVIVHANASIGSDGFGYAQHEKRFVKIPHVGQVHLGDDVEIGPNTTVIRAALGKTSVGRGTKVDAHVHVAHGVQIGEDAALAGFTGLSGGVVVGDRCLFGPRAGASDQIRIHPDTVLLHHATLISSNPRGGVFQGIPARPHMQEKRERGLPKVLARRIEALEARIRTLEENGKTSR